MNTTKLNAETVPVHYLKFAPPVEDFDVRRLAVKGYAYEHLSTHTPSMWIVICDEELKHTWLAVYTPDKRVAIEYVVYGAYLLLDDSRRIQEGNVEVESEVTE